MWHYFKRGPLENRVLKTRFIIQKNFKNLLSPKHGLTSPDRIRSERESDQREGDQIREREIVRSERERKRSRTWVAHLGCATQAARPGSRDPSAWPGSRDPSRANPGRAPRSRNRDLGRATLVRDFFFCVFFFFFLLLALISFLAGAVLVYMSFKSSL